MILTENQKDLIAKYLSDISKLIFAATVLDFFVRETGKETSVLTLVVGILMTFLIFVFSVIIRK
jgi:uncharacterized membrane protein